MGELHYISFSEFCELFRNAYFKEGILIAASAGVILETEGSVRKI